MKKIRKLSSLFIRQFAVVLLISVLLSVAATAHPERYLGLGIVGGTYGCFQRKCAL